VLSDFFIKEGYDTGLRMLVGRGYDLFCIQCLSPQEVDPTGPEGLAGDLRLKDVDESQMRMVNLAKDLANKGEIMIASKQGEDELIY